MFKDRVPSVLALFLFCACAAYFLLRNLKPLPYETTQVVWDLQWLNALAIAFIGLLCLVWTQPTSYRFKAWLSVVGLSIWGVVSVSLIFNGTPFGWNAYWGDQQFRTTMILKFMTFGWFTDFYYKDLPPYYPPLYFYLLGKYARLFSLEAYQMLKEGSYLIFAFGPILLYLMWRRLVSSFQAVCIVLACYLTQSMAIFATPHEFLASTFFVPWWLYFVDRVSSPLIRKRFFITGGIIGALIFMCFYYCFFIGAAVIVIRIVSLAWSANRRLRWISLKRSFAMLLSAAVFSSPYWLPLLGSMVFIGSSPGQNRWFHIGYANIRLPFIEFSVVGLVSLAGLVYVVRRYYVPINRALLQLVAAVPLYYVVGYVLGNLDMPLLYVKAAEFLNFVGAALIGLAAAGLVRLSWRARKRRVVFAAGMVLLLLFLLNSTTSLVQSRAVEVARNAVPDEKFTQIPEYEARVGKVFLTNAYMLGAFLPSYSFTSPSEHGSHPAGRFRERVAFLGLLEHFDDSYIMAAALRHNVFDRVDYIWPRYRGDMCEIPVTISNYPEKLFTRTFRYKRSLFADKSLFEHEGEIDCIRTLDVVPDSTRRLSGPAPQPRVDSLANIGKIYLLKDYMNSVGIELIDAYADVDWSKWRRVDKISDSRQFGGMLEVTSAQYAVADDSLFFLFEFEVLRDFTSDYRIFFHIYPGSPGRFDNYDFLPQVPTSNWKRGEVILCWQRAPERSGPFRYHLGFYDEFGRLGEGCWGTISQ